jgi:hypothetical protein
MQYRQCTVYRVQCGVSSAIKLCSLRVVYTRVVRGCGWRVAGAGASQCAWSMEL